MVHSVFHQFVDDLGNPVPDIIWTLLGPGQDKIASGSTADDGSVGTRVPDPGSHTLQYSFVLGTGDHDGPQADINPDDSGEV
jgi:hypothetical protein